MDEIMNIPSSDQQDSKEIKETKESKETLSFQDLRSIPRILIHAFCATKKVFDCMERVTEDRRMSKTHMKIHMGSIESAIEWCSSNSIPNLIIVETKHNKDDIINSLKELSKHCDPETKVIIIGHENDVFLYRELIDLGVSEYMIDPVSLTDIITSISNIFMDPKAAPLGKIIACIGAKGGVGSSTLAHNISWNIASTFSSEVIIADLDLPFGIANMNFDQDPERNIADALFSPERVDEVYIDRILTECAERLSLLSSPARLDRVYDIGPESFIQIIEIIQRTVPFVVLDIPHCWNGWTRETLKSADEIIITAMPDLSSLRNIKNILSVLHKLRPNDIEPRIIINQANIPKKPEITIEEFSKALNIKPFAVIPFDPKLFGLSLNNGRMLNETDQSNPISVTVSEISGILVGQSHAEKKSKNFFQELLEKMKQIK